MLNKSFYPTPSALISKMIFKIKGRPHKILDPSAGKGDLIEALESRWRYTGDGKLDISAIEIDPTLQATLRGKEFKLIDTDFLTYAGPDQFDLIIANPPFEDGDKHLHKALDIMYRGQIVFLLNAETLRNPYTNDRKLLVRRLEEAGAEIEYIRDAFVAAERKTSVEVALVNIVIDRKVEDDIFADCNDHAARCYATVTDKHEVSTGKTIEELVLEYEDVIRVGTETILGYYRNYRKVAKYIGLNREAKKYDFSSEDLTGKMQAAVNKLLKDVRADFWRRTLELKDFQAKLTEKKRREFSTALELHCHMNFTESNIRQFMLNLIGSYEQTLTEAVLDLFDMFTVRHSWSDDNRHEKNIHYFNGWKTNKAFKVGKRVVVPIGYRGSYDGPFTGYRGEWALNYEAARKLDDICKVMNYFDGGLPYRSLSDAIRGMFACDCNTGESTYFKFICHKKGTVHLTFKSEDILRRFNVVACRGKGWLPGDFGAKPYEQLSLEEKSVVDSFEGAKSYGEHLNQALFSVAAAVGLLEFSQADQYIDILPA